ncbi:DegT/DnrJ/EryC1/StrS family aminotransferase [Vibrio cincinnatiensis]|uniref:DegT/DnrJ/EryC1/StrS family aminotransferase n=1 Tax=Vibrio cincinnatiensis TaxID=675 RepID=UPI001EDCA934|nr:DegT/DnrJ/EryC1/StrS family aminotransferase [Vibrio cincinnatiensis]MCG3733167.1 DegT/DnrJ/EryC1/StrS family aminotransferase [Vibrio cincinnatiensis]
MITVFGSHVGENEICSVAESMRKQWMGMGPKVAQFESDFKHRLSIDNFIMVDSGSNALYMAITLLNLPKGAEIIVPSFTWVSCAQAVLLAGLKPVFCDVDIKTMNVTKETVKAQITEKTVAIMVVHYAGLPVDMDAIKELGLPIIEDAAHAVDSYYKGKACGSIADVGIYSFDAVKNLAVGEGGGVAVQCSDAAIRAKKLRYCGIGKSGFEASTHGKSRWWEYSIEEAFIKMNPSDIAGAIAVEQLKRLDDLQKLRKDIWDYYQSAFSGIEQVITPVEASQGDQHSYFTYCIRVPKRDELAKHLIDNNVYTTLRYHPLHLNPLYGQMDVRLENCEILNNDALSIPLHPNMSLDDAKKVVAEIFAFYKI